MPKCGMSYVFWIKSLGWSIVRCAPPHTSQENSPKYTFLQWTTDNFFLTTSCWYATVCLWQWRQAQHCKHSKLLPPEWLMVREWISEIILDTYLAKIWLTLIAIFDQLEVKAPKMARNSDAIGLLLLSWLQPQCEQNKLVQYQFSFANKTNLATYHIVSIQLINCCVLKKLTKENKILTT